MMGCRPRNGVAGAARVHHPAYICIEQPLKFFFLRVKNVATYQNVLCSHVKILMLGDGYEALLAVDNHHSLVGKSVILPMDVKPFTLITYPVERDRLDIFTRFLDPADVEPLNIRTSEMTVMMMQLVASGRGVCCLPNWALHEYTFRGYVTARRLGDKGLFPTLFAAVRTDMLTTP